MAPRRRQVVPRRTVIRMYRIDQAVLDRLEELELLMPVSRPRRERAYPLEDLDLLRVYRVLVDDLGVNAAGAEIILRLRGEFLQFQTQMGTLLTEMKAHGLLDKLQKLLGSLDERLR